MTGFASSAGSAHGYSWTAELRSVNGKGLDLRLRVPDWIDGLEPAVRGTISGYVQRGNVTLNLRLTREEQGAAVAVNPAQLDAVLNALTVIETAAQDRNVPLAPMRATDIANMRGVLDTPIAEEDTGPLKAVLTQACNEMGQALQDMRLSEGAALKDILERQLAEMVGHVEDAAAIAAQRAEAMAASLKANLAKVMDSADGADPDRVAQELALITVKADITEELDRLQAHIASARDLIAAKGPVGRKLDFLMQEFNREANTLCSKSQHAELTKSGLALKVLIDQMREQVQNVE
ncbi:MAG: YicC family protein [Rhodobacteraceae bacterium]|nr:YicC family protein [Paracoccaceae bacterium]